MTGISVLLPVAATTDDIGLQQAHDSILQQDMPAIEIMLVTNQPIQNDLNKRLKKLVNNNPETKHKHYPSASGLGGVLQRGLEVCSEQYVARMDADDVAEPDRFIRQYQLLSSTEADIVGAYLAEFHNNPEQVERVRQVPSTHEEIAEMMAWRCPLNHPTVMFDRAAVLKAGGYQEFPMMEDWDLWARCLATGLKFRNINTPLVRANVSDLAARRGGFTYVRSELRMAKKLRKLGISSRRELFQHIILRIPPRLLPKPLRALVYNKFVR